MGYENRIYVINVFRHSSNRETDYLNYGERIAVFDLGKSIPEYMVKKFFKTPVDFTIYEDDGNTRITEDMYGKKLASADIKEFINYLENYEEIEKRNNPLIPPFLAALKIYVSQNWRELQVVHYGY